MKPGKIIYGLVLLLAAFPLLLAAQPTLKNSCNGSTIPVLFTDAFNYFRIENWPGKALMNLECSCTIEFEDPGGVFKLIPSDAQQDTLKVFKDGDLVSEYILTHKEAEDLKIHLSGSQNKTISRKFLKQGAEIVIRSGKPGCRSNYTIQEYDLITSGDKIHVIGNKITTAVISQLAALKPGMQFNIENAVYLKGGIKKSLPSSEFLLKD